MSKEARAKVICHESFVADDENLPIQIKFLVQNSIENCIAKKQDKRLQPTVQLWKLKKEEIDIYTRKDTLQPKIILTKLKERYPEKDNSTKKQYSVVCRKNYQKFVIKSRQRNLLEENVQEISLE